MITPEQLARSNTEAAHQSALFCWAAMSMTAFPELRWLHSSTYGTMLGDNATARAIRGGRAKAQGMRAGVADIFLPVKRGNYSGLYIEQKRPGVKPKREGSKGGLSDEQILFRDFVQSQSFGWAVSYSWENSRDLIIQYLNWS
jgi:hypothetical protein